MTSCIFWHFLIVRTKMLSVATSIKIFSKRTTPLYWLELLSVTTNSIPPAGSPAEVLHLTVWNFCSVQQFRTSQLTVAQKRFVSTYPRYCTKRNILSVTTNSTPPAGSPAEVLHLTAWNFCSLLAIPLYSIWLSHKNAFGRNVLTPSYWLECAFGRYSFRNHR